MYLVQLLLPMRDNAGKKFASKIYRRVRRELTKEFGGVTAFTRAPALGFWKNKKNEVIHDQIIVFEVMLKKLDEKWWRDYKVLLEEIFSQDEIIIRIQNIQLL